MATIQASHETSEAMIVHTKARISMIRLLQHHAKNAKPSVIRENVRAKWYAISPHRQLESRRLLTDRLQN